MTNSFDSATGSATPPQKREPKPEKSKQQSITFHILSEPIPSHMAVNVSAMSPLLCGKIPNNSTKSPGEKRDGIVHQYRYIRDQYAQLNRFTDVGQPGWTYGIPTVIIHPEQLDMLCTMCYELSKEMTILIIKLDDAETIFHLDVSKAYQAWEKWKIEDEDNNDIGEVAS